jgi:multidrug efflux system membrane fusion protein
VQARIAQGATLSVTALDRTGAVTLAHGSLMTLDNQIDTSTGTVKAKARFGSPTRTACCSRASS